MSTITRNTSWYRKGFTLIEILIVMGILAVISTGLFLSNRSFDNSFEFTNVVFDVALMFREAQVLGISSRESIADQGQDPGIFENGYTIYYNQMTMGSATEQAIVRLYNDSNPAPTGDGNWGAQDLTLQEYYLPLGITVAEYCVTRSNGEELCRTSPTGSGPEAVNITFKRPLYAPEVKLRPPSFDDFVAASITLQTDTGRTRKIVIHETGLVDVESEFESGGPSNNPPTVVLTSPVTTTYTEPASISFGATASDSDGTIDRVEFLVDDVEIAEDSSSPYSYNWTGVSAGTYELKARAVDNLGAMTTTSGLTVTVNSSGGGGGFGLNDRVEVSVSSTNVYQCAGLSCNLRGTHASGDEGTVIGGPTDADGITWWGVNFDTTPDGWVDEDDLQLAP